MRAQHKLFSVNLSSAKDTPPPASFIYWRPYLFFLFAFGGFCSGIRSRSDPGPQPVRTGRRWHPQPVRPVRSRSALAGGGIRSRSDPGPQPGPSLAGGGRAGPILVRSRSRVRSYLLSIVGTVPNFPLDMRRMIPLLWINQQRGGCRKGE